MLGIAVSNAAIDYTYRYPFESAVTRDRIGANLQLATCAGKSESPLFFDGRILEPRLVGDMLLVLSEVVRTHFYEPRPALLDPVVTSHEAILRFEGFSGCCGVYARVDLPAEAFSSELQGRGTTNVDFNPPMRAALTKLRHDETVKLSIGRHEVALSRGDERVVEKKVKLPVRWVKGFSEVQAYQPRLSCQLEVPAAEAQRFMQSLPRDKRSNRPSFVVCHGRTLRLSQREQRGAVRLHGLHRIQVLEPLLSQASSLRIWRDDEAGTSGWEVVFERGRFFLMVSPETQRGFSGEGQVLETLARSDWQSVLSRIRAQLTWQAHIDPTGVGASLGLDAKQVEVALAVLGARGLAGYDVASGCYFHRELPFDLDKVETLQPRLANARKLLAADKVRVLQGADGGTDVQVAGTGTHHYVRLRQTGDRCTCPWFSRYQGKRGVCKHILAARLSVESGVASESISQARECI